jgi:hypothetical protein
MLQVLKTFHSLPITNRDGELEDPQRPNVRYVQFLCIVYELFISSIIEDYMPNYLVLLSSRKFRSLPLLLSSESDSSSLLEERVRSVMPTLSTLMFSIANAFKIFPSIGPRLLVSGKINLTAVGKPQESV